MPSYEDVIQRAGSLRAMTGLTEQEFTALLPHFEHACVTYMQDHTIDGQPRTSRRYSTYETCPLPTIADKLLFILTYVKQNPIFLHPEIVQSVFSSWLVPNYRTAKYEYLPAGIFAIWLLALQKCSVSAFALFTYAVTDRLPTALGGVTAAI